LNLLRDVGLGLPVFGSPKAFVNALKQTRGSPFTEMAKQLNIPPMQIVAEDRLIAAITVESKVFSIYATGYVKSGKRETRVKIHSVVDFRGAPTIGGTTLPPGGNNPTPAPTGNPAPPIGAMQQGIQAALEPNAAGNMVYYRVE